MTEQIKIFSFGGGIQSTACLVLAAQKKIDYKIFAFSNVGNDSEHPETIDYIQKISKPFAELHGLTFVELQKNTKKGPETLMDLLVRSKRSIPIPIFHDNGPPGRRSCTVDFKIKVIAKYAKNLGAKPNNKAIIGIGISTDEIIRAKPNQIPFLESNWPLIDLMMDRKQCERLIQEAGLPVPPRSSCYFCPFHRKSKWLEMYTKQPDLFEKSCQLEEMLNERSIGLGRGPVYLSSWRKPLREAVNGSHEWQLNWMDQMNIEENSCGPFLCSGDNSDTEIFTKKTK